MSGRDCVRPARRRDGRSTISLAVDASATANLRDATLPNQQIKNGTVATY